MIPQSLIKTRSKSQKSRSQGEEVQKVVTRQPCSAILLGCSAVMPLNETAPHGRHELCILSSAQPLVNLYFII